MNVDLKGQVAVVLFDRGRTDVSALREAVQRAGYEPKSEVVSEA